MELEVDMGDYFKCYPNFDSMDFYEFLMKYDKVNQRIKERNKNGNSVVNFLQQFQSFVNGQ